MKVFIETERLILRDWEEEDLSSFAKMNADECVMEYFLKTLSEDESRELLERMRTEIKETDFGFFAVERKEDKQFIGCVGLHEITFDIDFAPAVEIGWRLMPGFWGMGYAPEAAKACLGFAENQLHLKEVVSFTAFSNLKSQRVMQKIGMDFVKEFNHPLVNEGHPLQRHVLYKREF